MTRPSCAPRRARSAMPRVPSASSRSRTPRKRAAAAAKSSSCARHMPPEPGPATLRGCLITGTDTGAGKSVLTAVVLAALAGAGEPVRAYKPMVTGADEPAGQWPPDDELLALAARRPRGEVVTRRLGPAVSPHLALATEGVTVTPAELCADARRL